MKITKHAYGRAKSRFGWKKPTAQKMAKIAIKKGFKDNKSLPKNYKSYFHHLWKMNKNATNIRIHGEVVYVFVKDILLTIFKVDTNMLIRLDSK